MAYEIDKGGREIDEILKKRKMEALAMGESSAHKNLEDVLKDLNKNRNQTDLVEEEAIKLQD